jgi:thiamine-phosphate pyrophosphorylase
MSPPLWIVTDAHRLPDPTSILRTLPPGSGVIIRHRDAVARLQLAARVLPVCRARRITLLVSGDWRTAHQLRADGVHLPEKELAQMSAGLRLWRKAARAILSCAAHNLVAVRQARECDLVFLSPVFPTRSHPNRPALGRLRYARLAHASRVPVVAMGGLTAGNLRALNGTRTSGIAGIGFATDRV